VLFPVQEPPRVEKSPTEKQVEQNVCLSGCISRYAPDRE
jgi:hypothetical protein